MTEAMVEAFYEWRFENQDSLSCGGHGNLADLVASLSAAIA